MLGCQEMNRYLDINVFPGIALVLIVFGINLLADWLREEINPKIMKGKVSE